ncbi:MAG TPA: fumarylacetoacetate hydrolase family protein, partial [Microbacteriaceae bacterium]|nr:fumarylacetoacetate hydrolase family protein [Microbacteriaceae bacterium]
MRFAHLHVVGHPRPRLAVVDGQRAAFVDEFLDDAPGLLQTLIERGPAELARVRAGIASAGTWHELGDLRFDSAVLRPPHVLAVGANYSAHSSELKLKTGSAMTVFGLWPNSLAGHEGTTRWSSDASSQVDYEAELGVVIGRDVPRGTKAATALDFVFGYTAVNDITARDIQFSEAQWSRCKSFDGFTPTGPVVVTADEIPDPQDLWLTCVVDGRMLQDGRTSDMIRSVADIIETLSATATIPAGTLISTGSPGGAGYSREPQVFLRDG